MMSRPVCMSTNEPGLPAAVDHTQGLPCVAFPFGKRDLPNAVLLGRKDSFDNHPDNNRC